MESVNRKTVFLSDNSYHVAGLVWGSGGSAVKNLPAMWDLWVRSLVRKIPWRKAWQPTPAFLSGESQGQKGLAGYSPYGQSQT